MPPDVLMHFCVCMCECTLCYTCSTGTKKMHLKESVSISINVAQVSNVNINTEKALSPLPRLGAVSRSRRQRWWLVGTKRRRGDSFLQLELLPSGNTHGQKNTISIRTSNLTHRNTHKADWPPCTAASKANCKRWGRI